MDNQSENYSEKLGSPSCERFERTSFFVQNSELKVGPVEA
jgi:hypothetical protein